MKLCLKGEWLTLSALMLIFWSNFTEGFLRATSPEVLEQTKFTIIFAAVVGAASGTFKGRAIAMLRMQDR